MSRLSVGQGPRAVETLTQKTPDTGPSREWEPLSGGRGVSSGVHEGWDVEEKTGVSSTVSGGQYSGPGGSLEGGFQLTTRGVDETFALQCLVLTAAPCLGPVGQRTGGGSSPATYPEDSGSRGCVCDASGSPEPLLPYSSRELPRAVCRQRKHVVLEEGSSLCLPDETSFVPTDW